MKYTSSLFVLPLLAGSMFLASCGADTTSTSSGGLLTFGSANAPVKLVEYLDFQCTHCKDFNDTAMSMIMKEYIQTGKAQLEVRDFPLFATSAITQNAAHCAYAEGKYPEYTALLFENQEAHTKESLKKFGSDVGLTSESFATCVDKENFKSVVKQNQAKGIAQGVKGTPSLFVNDKMLEMKTLDDIRKAIDSGLEK